MPARSCQTNTLPNALLCATALLSGPCAGAIAQSKPAAPASAPTVPEPEAKPAASKPGNVKSGDISAIDVAADTLTLKDGAGKSAIYVLTPKTHYNRNRRPAQRSDFKVGESAVLHFRRSRTDGAMLVSELDDPASWTWLGGVRKTTTAAVVKLISDDTLSVAVGPDHVPLDYTISEKTRWQKAGKDVAASAFKPGDRVFIVPRSLPSGSIMARAVADTTSGAAQEKERLAASVHGAVQSVDLAAHKLVIKTVAGDVRSLAFNDETEILSAGKAVSQAALKPGLHVAVRVRHDPGGDEDAWRITVETARKSPAPRKRPAGAKGAAAPN